MPSDHADLLLFCGRTGYEAVRSFAALYQGDYAIPPWTHIRPEDRDAIMNGVELWLDGGNPGAFSEWCAAVYKDAERSTLFKDILDACHAAVLVREKAIATAHLSSTVNGSVGGKGARP